MKILDNIIIDFDFPGNFHESIEKEVEFLECFLSENSQLVFLELESNLFPSSNSEITGVSQEIKKIVLENTIIKTKEKLLNIHYDTDENEYFYWFSPKIKKDLIEIVKNKYSFYICIVLKKNEKNIQTYDYLLDIQENFKIKENSDCRALIIEEKIQNSFKNNIKPKLENLFSYLMN